MATLVETLHLTANPFEHYTAENEPHIIEYAVRPPYLQAIAARAKGLSTFILFGDRGAGKSATRITVFNEVWSSDTRGEKRPLIVNFTDFSSLLPQLRKSQLADKDMIESVSFFVVEQLMLWLSSLEDEERKTLVETMNESEVALCSTFVTDFYLSRPEFERQFRTEEAFKLLNSAWTTRSAAWANKRWDAVSAVIATVISAFTKKAVDPSLEVGEAAEGLLKALRGDTPQAGRAVLVKLVALVRIFGFSGVCIFVDKVDENEVTTNSAESSSRLVYPILSHIQLLEVDGFSWQFFLWNKIKGFFEGNEFNVRLDKIAHATIAWDGSTFRAMLEARMRYFSGKRVGFADLFDGTTDVDAAFELVAAMSMGSPRELIKIMDTLVREHDLKNSGDDHVCLSIESVNSGLDKYAKDTISSVFNERTLDQIYRVRSVRFINKDVQLAFKVGDQSARAKIKAWEDAGIVKFSGTRAAEGELGGKPSNEYAIADARLERIIRRDLIKIEELEDITEV